MQNLLMGTKIGGKSKEMQGYGVHNREFEHYGSR